MSQVANVKNFVFTVNMVDSETEDSTMVDGTGTIAVAESNIRDLFESGDVSYVVASMERGEDNGRLHLQGYIQCKERHRYGWVKNRIHPTCYVAPQKANDSTKAQMYALGFTPPEFTERKDGFVEVRLDMGEFIPSSQGKRTDIESVRDAVDLGEITNIDEVIDLAPAVAARYPGFINTLLERKARSEYAGDRMEQLGRIKLRTWQYWLCKYLDEVEPDDRKIIFVIDKDGAAGKSTFTEYYKFFGKRACDYARPGRKQDMAEMLELGKEVMFMDIPRNCKAEFLQHVYIHLEEAKDGRVVAPKYRSRMKVFRPPHIVVFMNIDVDIGGTFQVPPNPFEGTTGQSVETRPPVLTWDRYLIWTMDEDLVAPRIHQGSRYYDSFPPFESFEGPGMNPIPYHPPLIETSGPQFNGDMAGDGPDTRAHNECELDFEVPFGWPSLPDGENVSYIFGAPMFWCMQAGMWMPLFRDHTLTTFWRNGWATSDTWYVVFSRFEADGDIAYTYASIPSVTTGNWSAVYPPPPSSSVGSCSETEDETLSDEDSLDYSDGSDDDMTG